MNGHLFHSVYVNFRLSVVRFAGSAKPASTVRRHNGVVQHVHPLRDVLHASGSGQMVHNLLLIDSLDPHHPHGLGHLIRGK